MTEMSVAEAATALGINPSRMRALVANGAVSGRRVGGRWVVDASAVRARATTPRAGSRPMAPATAWAAAWLMDGGTAPWLSAADRSRLRARLRANADLTMECWLGWARNRASVRRLRADDRALAELLSDSRIRLGGLSAAPHTGLDLVGSGSEVYVAQADLDAVTHEYMLLSSTSSSNVVVHVVPGPWHLGVSKLVDSGSSVPRAVVVADLFEAGDARSRRAAQTLLTTVNADARCGV